MGILTSQKISVYYERFKTIEVTFTKEIIQVTRLITNQVYLKCVSDFWPCVIYSSSFQGAKIVVNIASGILQKLEKANNMVSLRFCFLNPDTGNPVAFFVNTRSLGYTAYGAAKDAALFSLQFTQRPPGDLIEIMGRILDANVNSAKRREERILITTDSARRLNLRSKEVAVFIQGVPRRCILRDVSFSGAKIIMMGVAKFLLNRDVGLRLDFDDPRESFQIRGKFIRSEIVEGRKELIALAILFDDNQVPMGDKIRLNDFLSQTRAAERGGEEKAAQKSASMARPAAPPAAAPGGGKPAEAPPPAAPTAAPAAPEPQPEPPPDEAPASEDFNEDFNLEIN
jgi:hypothetical protein